jgi:peptidoglycan/xylan/chitin deacetylase (PgdA/CDA1 family)
MNLRRGLFNRLVMAVAMMAGVAACAAETAVPTPSDTTVLKWRDGKKAVFLLAFDDSCRSHVKNAIPELQKRGLVGTFYINPGNGPFQSERPAWEQVLPKSPAVVYGNHTFKHQGVTNAAQLDVELSKCDAVIQACYPERKQPFLISFGRPGGVPWKVSEEEKQQALAKYHLVERPPFFGYPFHVKTAEALCKLVDQAIAKGDMGHHDAHGVGGDWLVTPMEVYTALLDKLVACRDEVWVTDHISYHKYVTERSSAEVRVVQSDKAQIRIRLSCAADPALYDAALTLETRVPADWTTCRVVQGKTRAEVAAVHGVVRYAAVPGQDEIVLTER